MGPTQSACIGPTSAMDCNLRMLQICREASLREATCEIAVPAQWAVPTCWRCILEQHRLAWVVLRQVVQRLGRGWEGALEAGRVEWGRLGQEGEWNWGNRLLPYPSADPPPILSYVTPGFPDLLFSWGRSKKPYGDGWSFTWGKRKYIPLP